MSRTAICLTGLALSAVVCSLHWSQLLAEEPAADKTPPAAKAPARDAPASRGIVSIADSIATAEQIEEALDRPINVSFHDDRLTDCLDFVGELLKIQIHIDVLRLKRDEGVEPDTPIDLQLKGVRARQVLKTILEPLTLDYVVREGFLQITSVTAADEFLDTHAYDVSELLLVRDDDSLKETITESVAMYSWGEVGGTAMACINESILIVRQTPRAHREVRKLLADMIAADKVASQRPEANKWTVRTYTVGDQPTAEVIKTLLEMVSPKTWQPAGGKGEIRAAGNTLFIRQTPAVHRAIERLLVSAVPLSPFEILKKMSFKDIKPYQSD